MKQRVTYVTDGDDGGDGSITGPIRVFSS